MLIIQQPPKTCQTVISPLVVFLTFPRLGSIIEETRKSRKPERISPIMAKISRPLDSEKARGAIGGVIFSESNNVNYVRRNTVRPYEKTEARKEVASRLNSAAVAWTNLSEANKKAWEDFAESTAAWNAFGEKYTKPAFSWFVGCRENLHSVKRTANPNITGAEFPRDVEKLGKYKTTGSIITFTIRERNTNTDPYIRLRIYKSKVPSTTRYFNISECELWKPYTCTYQQNVYRYTPQELEQIKGIYTLYAQFVDIRSGLAGELRQQRITLE